MAQKRFRIALSYPGERRAFVEQVANRLATAVGRERVLYDRYYEAEFARPDLDTYLQRLYHDEADLIAVFLGADYEHKEWCGLEWRVVRDMIKRRRGSDVIPLRFDDTEVPGLFSTDGYIWLPGREPEEVADLLLQRMGVRVGDGGDHAGGPVAPSRLTHSADRLFGRDEELAKLHTAWKDPGCNVVTIVAWGGEGKTSLVSHWQADLARRSYDGARYFDWSFYSQGTREQGGASADQFIARALEFFGDPELAGSAASPWDKGARLAELVARQRTLLVLDGLEPLQDPPGPLAGELKDQALRALLRGLAQRNPGLCVVTTRERVADLTPFRASTAPEWELHHLPLAAGVDLLKTLGVHGAEAELRRLVGDVKGHALTLNLLGRYLARAHSGDIRRRDQVHIEKADAKIQGRHAFKAMAAYEKWLLEGGEDGARQLAVLQLLGLFDRPADAFQLSELRREPAIAGLTEPLVELEDEDWNYTLSLLADSGLVSVLPQSSLWGSEDSSIDAHPLIREYFATQYCAKNPEAWRAAHLRLYEYLKGSVEHRPDTLAGLQPLYQAVVHGCQAGKYQEACNDVFYDRIRRRHEAYSWAHLGLFGADLGALACFFETPWSRPSQSLTISDQAWLLGETAFTLDALGRLTEAAEPTRISLQTRIEQNDWHNAAVAAETLSRTEQTLGNLAAALADAEQIVIYANRSGDAFQRLVGRATLANSLHQAGRQDESLALFREAEEIQAASQPTTPLLYSVRGFQYCDLLLAEAERAAWRNVISMGRNSQPDKDDAGAPSHSINYRDVEQRAIKSLAIAERRNWLLDIALNHLTLGRAALYGSLLNVSESLSDRRLALEHPGNTRAGQHLVVAVDGLRRAGTEAHVPRGLLSRAWLRVLEGDIDAARADLDAAWQIAEHGPMRLHMADIHLYRARLFHAVKPYPWESPQADLAAARRLIEQCGYWRRREELEDAEATALEW